MKKLSLLSYLEPKDLTEELKLTSELSFHWANWDETCLLQRKNFKNYKNNFHLTKLNQALNDLKMKPVWLCNKVKIIKTDLYSLYESYLDSRLRLTWFERKDEILFSFDSEQGPYFTLTSMKWFDKNIYSQFVMRKILLEHFTLRSFRLSSTIPITFKLNNDVNTYTDKVVIHQISEAGFILKIKDKNFINKIKNSQYLELKIPTITYKNASCSDNIDEMIEKMNIDNTRKEEDSKVFTLDSKIFNFYGNFNNALRSSDEEFCIFARYEDLVARGHEEELKKIFAPIVTKTKNYFQLSMHIDHVKKSA